jgi:hypothetical protein
MVDTSIGRDMKEDKDLISAFKCHGYITPGSWIIVPERTLDDLLGYGKSLYQVRRLVKNVLLKMN